jgi:tetratricopeptide (TPR) repeat protein
LREEADERARRAELERVKAEGEKVAAEMRAAEQRKRRRVQLALLGAVGLLLLVGLTFGWWARERQARNAEAVAGLLDQCERALQSGDAVAAAMPLEAAQRRAEESGVANQAGRLERFQEDLAVLRDLDAVDQVRWTPVEGKTLKSAEVATRYHEALGRFGADPDAVGEEQAAARVSGSSVRARLVGALDRLLRAERSAAVRAALQVLDPDPFRDAVRDTERDNDAAALIKLAGRVEALQQPTGFSAFLGESKAISPERARAVLGTAVQRRPGELGLLMALGGSYPLNQREGAEERARWGQAAVAVAPTNCNAHSNLGIALKDKGNLDGAIVEFREAIRLDPKYGWAHNNLGAALIDKGDPDGAIVEFREAIRLDPKVALPHSNLGGALNDKRDLDGAIAEFREAMRLDPKLAHAHHGLGWSLQLKRDLDGAIVEYREAIQLDPKYVWTHTNLGDVLKDKRDLDGAIVEFREAIRLDPKFAMAYKGLGWALHEKGDLAGSEAAIREPIRLDPKSVVAHTDLGWLLWAKGDLDGAVAAFRRAVALDPEHDHDDGGLCYALWGKGDFEGAMAVVRRQMALNPKGGYTSLAWLLANSPERKSHRPHEAIASAKKALELDPNNGVAWIFLGLAHYRAGQWKEAIDALEKSLQLHDGWGDQQFFLAMAHQRAGRNDNARRWYRQGLDLMAKSATTKNPFMLRARAEAAEVLGLKDGK